jgi:hypothetical protein
MTCFWNNLLQVPARSRKIGKPNNVKIFRSNKTKGHKQDRQNQLRSPMPDGGDPAFLGPSGAIVLSAGNTIEIQQ